MLIPSQQISSLYEGDSNWLTQALQALSEPKFQDLIQLLDLLVGLKLMVNFIPLS